MLTKQNTFRCFLAATALLSPLCHGFTQSSLVPMARTSTTKTMIRPFPPTASILRHMAETDDDSSASATTTTGTTIRSADGEASSSDSGFSLDSIQEWLNRIDVSSLNLDTIRENALSGELGTRGEVYFAAQAVLLLCILIGGVPFFGDTLTLLLGPGLLLAGAAVLVLGTVDLGDALSPWPVPTNKSGLKTGGIYAQMRHPMYAGSLAAAAGFSIITDSATRLLLTAILLYALEVKATYEEEALVEKFPNEYPKYQQDVPGKFIPTAILNALPWNKKEGGNEEDES